MLEKQHRTVLWIFVCFLDRDAPAHNLSEAYCLTRKKSQNLPSDCPSPALRSPAYLPTPQLVMRVAAAGGPGTPAMSDRCIQ